MKALQAFAPYDYRLVDVDMPAVRAGTVLLRVKGCGVCAGDLKSYHGGVRIWGTSAADRYIEPPVTGGHEFYGEVVAVGEGVCGVSVGDLAVAEQIAPCGTCVYCQRGTYHMCTESAVYGFKSHIQGGFAEYILLHERSVIRVLPPQFTLEQAVMVEPYACGMHAVERANIGHADTVVISGLGAIGCAIANLVKLALPRRIIGVEPRAYRRDMGLQYGCDAVIDPMSHDAATVVRDLTDGLGCDVYIEASGNPRSVSQGLDCLRNHGTYVQFGMFADAVTADWNIIGDGKELTVVGSHLSGHCFPAVIDGIVSGLLKTDGLVSHTFALDDWQTAFDTAEKDERAMKVAFRM